MPRQWDEGTGIHKGNPGLAVYVYGGLIATILDGWGPPGKYGDIPEMPKDLEELLQGVDPTKGKSNAQAVAAAVGWPLLTA